MNKKVHAVLKRHENGSWMLGIRAMPIEVDGDADGLYTLLDVDENVDLSVNCDGITKRPRLILKLYCKLSQKENGEVRKKMALTAARARSPMLH